MVKFCQKITVIASEEFDCERLTLSFFGEPERGMEKGTLGKFTYPSGHTNNNAVARLKFAFNPFPPYPELSASDIVPDGMRSYGYSV
jgi:hypothetical protein